MTLLLVLLGLLVTAALVWETWGLDRRNADLRRLLGRHEGDR